MSAVLPTSVPELVARLRAYPLTTPHDELAKAAVATIVKPGLDGLDVLYIKRAEFEGDRWSGHVAFPGGKRDATDASLLETVIRETFEELALVLPPSSLVLRLPDLTGRITKLQIAQFVFALDVPDVTLVTNAEVEAAVWVPLSSLTDPAFAGTRDTDQAGNPAELPTIRIGKYVLWGMSHRLTRVFTDALGG